MNRLLRFLAPALLALAGGVLAAPAAPAGTRWAAPDVAVITPGVQMVTGGAQCTANFVFTDAKRRVYVGYSAHCAGLGTATDTNGCATDSHPLGTRVTFEVGGTPVSAGEVVGRGRLAYSSWRTMRELGVRDDVACAYNDFALVRVARRDVGKVNPSVPGWGGPVGLDRDGLAVGEQVFSYGSSSLRGGLALTGPKVGVATGQDESGWSHSIYTLTPGIPGDSGSGVLDATGLAVGTLSTIAVAPFPGENGVGDLAKELAFAQRHSGIPGLRLVKGTEPFRGLG